MEAPRVAPRCGQSRHFAGGARPPLWRARAPWFSQRVQNQSPGRQMTPSASASPLGSCGADRAAVAVAAAAAFAESSATPAAAASAAVT
jgi:hypothetical protein